MNGKYLTGVVLSALLFAPVTTNCLSPYVKDSSRLLGKLLTSVGLASTVVINKTAQLVSKTSLSRKPKMMIVGLTTVSSAVILYEILNQMLPYETEEFKSRFGFGSRNWDIEDWKLISELLDLCLFETKKTPRFRV